MQITNYLTATVYNNLCLLILDNKCTDHFSSQQVARMHCYIDHVYQTWQLVLKPSPVPLAPKVRYIFGDLK